MTDKDKALCEIYVKRNNEVIELLKQGMSWEQIQEKVARYQDEIDELVTSPRELEKKNSPELEPEVGKQIGIYELEGMLLDKLTVVNGKNLFKRILIRRVGIRTYMGEGEWVLNIEPEEAEGYLNPYKGYGAYIEMGLPTETE